MSVTAQLIRINEEFVAGDKVVYRDTISICRDGVEIDTVTVEPAEDEAPYTAAVIAAGYPDATWIN